MEFVTILGNLTVLGIVGIVLTLYRKADKNNKSLEQINKYANKRAEEFDQYVDEKIAELKDLSVGLEVQEKTGIVILGKISEEVDALSEKIAHIEELNTKVIGYNSTMDKMLSLSNELQEKYEILKKDAQYMEGLDKRVKEGGRKLFTVEKGIKEITSEFIKSNNNSIQKLKEEIFEATTKDIEALNENITKSESFISELNSKLDIISDSFETSSVEKLTNFKISLDSLVDSHKDNISKITVESQNAEDSAFNEMKERIERRREDLLKLLDDRIKEVEDNNSGKIEKLSMDMGNVENIANKIQEENRLRLESIKDQLDKQLILLKEANSVGVNSLQEEFSSNFKEFKEFSWEQIEKAKSESQILLDQVKEQFSEIEEHRDDVKEKIASTEDYIVREFKDIQDRVEGSIFEITRDLSKQEESVKDEAIKYLENNIHLFKDEVDSKLEEFTGVSKQINDIKEDLLNKLEINTSQYREKVDSKLEEFDGVSKEIDCIKEDLLNKLDLSVIQYKERVDDKVEELSEATNQIDDIKNTIFTRLEESVEQYRSRVDRKLSEITAIDEDIDKFKNESKEQFISKIDLYNREIDDRFKELEALPGEVEGIKKNITDRVADTIDKIESDLNIVHSKQKEFDDSLKELNSKISIGDEDIKEQILTHHQQLKEDMLFEMTSNLEKFREAFIQKMESFEGFEDDIDKAKDELLEVINNRHVDINEKYTLFHNSISEKMADDKSQLLSFMEMFNSEKENLEIQINSLKESAYNNISEKLNAFEDEYFTKLKEKEESIEIETRNWKELLEKSVREIKDESFKSVLADMDNITSDVSHFKDSIVSDISSFKEGAESKIEELLASLRENEKNLVDESESVKSEVREDIRILRDELSTLQSDVTENSESLRETLSNISEEQERFVRESEIFNRTDELRDDLTKAIDILTNQLDIVHEKSGFISSVTEELTELRLLTSKVNTQIDSVDNKKTIIDSLETRVSKVLELSDSVDDKLSRIKDTEDKVGEVQLKLRGLKDLEDEVKEDLERLEKKQDILAETNKAIDSGFSHIQIIENKLDALKDNLIPFNNQIDNVKGKLSSVEEREARIDKAIATLSTLDSSVKDMEEKITKMDKAREWIAGVETRLNESVRTANEQVKLMGALAQDKGSKKVGSNEPGAPNMNMREMVIKLAHNNWKPEDIARTTKLSRGEVELILELSPRK